MSDVFSAPALTPRQYREMLEALEVLEAAHAAFARARANNIMGNDDLVDAACARVARELHCLRSLFMLQRAPTMHLVQE
ncbi:hypothetical protein [Paraburkholderia sp. C35]|uniref:hypothetical protein n=1 Tax=Paraburkholderia sp. C35 TaxID=2126993 RepID=UPI0013A5822D|nr:hypothetical protein [Paraburkholderia sp. C35]